MYSITCKKRKPLDLLKILLLKIYPNVTDFYPKMVPLNVKGKKKKSPIILVVLLPL